jgi:hypothetical protein
MERIVCVENEIKEAEAPPVEDINPEPEQNEEEE